MNTHNVILTGIPRSGTTLTCYLLNKLPNTVALNESIVPSRWDGVGEVQPLVDAIAGHFMSMRQSLYRHGTAISRHTNGQIPDNPKGGYPFPFNLLPDQWASRLVRRRNLVRRGAIQITKPLSHDFLLCIKQTGYFTNLLPTLRSHYPCYAIVRHPLSILASWNTINFGAYYGRSPAAERINPLLAQQLDRIADRFERQIYLLNWFFETYHTGMPDAHIIRYEEIVASHGASLQRITPDAKSLDEPLENKNRNRLYNQELMSFLATKLSRADGAFWHFYPKESIADVRVGEDA